MKDNNITLFDFNSGSDEKIDWKKEAIINQNMF